MCIKKENYLVILLTKSIERMCCIKRAHCRRVVIVCDDRLRGCVIERVSC